MLARRLSNTFRSAIAAAIVTAISCGPRTATEKPGGKGFTPVPEPVVSFPANLDIPLDVPDDPGKLPLPEVLWKGDPAVAFVMAGHLVVTVDDGSGKVVARDVRDGNVAWSSNIGMCPVCAFRLTPVFDGARVIVSSGSRLIALGIEDGAEAWSIDVDGLPDGGGVMAADGVLAFRTIEPMLGPSCSSVTTRILFVNVEAGLLVWQIQYSGLFAVMAVGGGYLHTVVSEGCDPAAGGSTTGFTMRVTSLTSRKEMARVPVSEPYADPVLAGGVMVFVGSDGLEAYEPGTTSPVWVVPMPEPAQAVASLGDQVLVARRKELLILDGATGDTVLSRGLGEVYFRQGLNVLPTIGVTASHIIVPTEPDPLRGYVVVLDRVTGYVKRMFLGYGPVYQTEAWGGIGILLLPEATVAMDLVCEGTPERDLVPVASAVDRLVQDAEDDLPFVNWAATALEIDRMGPEGLDALAAMDGSIIAGMLASMILAGHPRADMVPYLAKLVAWPPPGSGDWLPELHARMVYEAIHALSGAGGAQVVVPLAGVVRGDDVDPALRTAAWAALGTVAATGEAEAIAEIASYRAERAKETSGGWMPCPMPEHAFARSGPFSVHGPCEIDLDTAFSSASSAVSEAGDVMAYVSPALGGRNDVWLATLGKGGGISGRWFTGLTVPGLMEIQFIEDQGAGRVLLETVERECDGCYLEESDRPESGKPVETIVDVDEIGKDSDKDGWTDLVESRLGTSPKKKDSDGDGSPDPADPAPIGSIAAKGKADARKAVVVEAVFAYLGFVASDEPLFVVGPDEINLPFEGYPAIVLHLGPDEAVAMQKRLGIPGPPFISFTCPVGEDGSTLPGCAQDIAGSTGDPMGFVTLSADGDHAALGLLAYRSDADSALYIVEATRIDGTWVVSRFDLAGLI